MEPGGSLGGGPDLLQLGSLPLVGVGQLLAVVVGLGPLGLPGGLGHAQRLVGQLLGGLPQRDQRRAVRLRHHLGHRDGDRGRLDGLRAAPFAHHGARRVHVDTRVTAHGVHRGHRLAAVLLVQLLGGLDDALAHVGGDGDGHERGLLPLG
ncbi:hypothetical protein D3C78_1029140 [compost metagenome]